MVIEYAYRVVTCSCCCVVVVVLLLLQLVMMVYMVWYTIYIYTIPYIGL